MFSISVDKNDLFSEFPFVENDWLKAIKSIPNTNIKDNRLEFYYTYGYFVPKKRDESNTEIYNKVIELQYEERLKYELDKVRVSITIKHGHLMFTNRLPKKQIPFIIKEIVTELTKVKMNLEYEYHKNDQVFKSVPPINTNLVSVEVLDSYDEDKTYDIDDILDKINDTGIESLTEDEKEFLNNLNK